MKILLIDNYDSFVYNLYQAIGKYERDITVKRNDQLSIDEIEGYDAVVLSPGPGDPRRNFKIGIGLEMIKQFYSSKPILGVCLGHQEICYALGGKIRRAKRIVHGKKSLIKHFGSVLFEGIPEKFTAGRYHSLVVYQLPNELKLTAISMEDHEIMAVEHIRYPVFGLQFHPESILTTKGELILFNFLRVCKK
jgi:anthranilate synthase component 2